MWGERSRRLAALCVALISVLWAAPAAGMAGGGPGGRLFAGVESAAGAEERARELFREGQSQYDAGRFEEALELWSRAYELLPHPGFVFNLGQCYRHLGRYGEALQAYTKYLAEMPEAPNRDLVEELIAEVEARLGEEEVASKETEESEPEAAPEDVGEVEEDREPDALAEGHEEEKETADAEAAEVAMISEPEEIGPADPGPELSPEAVASDARLEGVAPGAAVVEEGPPSRVSWWAWPATGTVVMAVVIGAVVLMQPEEVPGGSLGTLDWRLERSGR